MGRLLASNYINVGIDLPNSGEAKSTQYFYYRTCWALPASLKAEPTRTPCLPGKLIQKRKKCVETKGAPSTKHFKAA